MINKKGNFWFWFGIFLIFLFGLILFLNMSNFEKIPPDQGFLVWIFGVAFVMGILFTISAYLKKNP